MAIPCRNRQIASKWTKTCPLMVRGSHQRWSNRRSVYQINSGGGGNQDEFASSRWNKNTATYDANSCIPISSIPQDVYRQDMKRKLTARDLEIKAIHDRPPKASSNLVPSGEAMAMLARRGLKPEKTVGDVPFPHDLMGETADRLSEKLDHYPFRLFLRGAIRNAASFQPSETTQYLKPYQSREYAEFLVDAGLAERLPRDHYRLVWPAKSFGGTLEWYVARELHRRFGFDVATGVQLHVRGLGGDLDVIAAAEGKLIYLELKSSPPKNLATAEIAAFFDRFCLLRPDMALFVVDTALRLRDKVLPMLQNELCRRRGGLAVAPKRIAQELWALTPHLYAVNGRRDLMANVARSIAEGLRALAPEI